MHEAELSVLPRKFAFPGLLPLRSLLTYSHLKFGAVLHFFPRRFDGTTEHKCVGCVAQLSKLKRGIRRWRQEKAEFKKGFLIPGEELGTAKAQISLSFPQMQQRLRFAFSIRTASANSNGSSFPSTRTRCGTATCWTCGP